MVGFKIVLASTCGDLLLSHQCDNYALEDVLYGVSSLPSPRVLVFASRSGIPSGRRKIPLVACISLSL